MFFNTQCVARNEQFHSKGVSLQENFFEIEEAWKTQNCAIMSKNANSLLPKAELIIILLFLIVFFIWMIPKCSSSQRTKRAELLHRDSIAQLVDVIPKDSAQVAQPDSAVAPTPATPIPGSAASPIQTELNRLYITINKLKLRKDPDLKSEVLAELPLFEEVYFLNEVTDSTFEVNLGYEKADEPYVKVRTKRGIEGWVYGAGVHYHKKKRSGVLE